MLPLGLLTAAQGHPMLVELKNGETLNGHLVTCDNWMNLILREVVQTSPEGDKFFRLPEVYIRGNNIKYLRVPEEIIDIVKEQQANQPQGRRGGHRDGGRERGRGGGPRSPPTIRLSAPTPTPTLTPRRHYSSHARPSEEKHIGNSTPVSENPRDASTQCPNPRLPSNIHHDITTVSIDELNKPYFTDEGNSVTESYEDDSSPRSDPGISSNDPPKPKQRSRPLRKEYGQLWKKSQSDLEAILQGEENPGFVGTIEVLRSLIRDRHVEPRARHYKAMIQANTDNTLGNVNSVHHLLQEMEDNDIAADSGTLHAALQAFAVHPDYILRQEVLQKLRDRWLTLSPAGWHFVVVGLLRDHQFELALDQLALMERKEIPVENWLHSSLIYHLCDVEEFDEVYRLMRARVEQGHDMTTALWKHVLGTASTAGHYLATSYVWKRMVELDYLQPSKDVCSKVLTVAELAEDTELANSVFRLMDNKGMTPGQEDYATLIMSKLSAGDLPTAFDVLCAMQQEGTSPNQVATRPMLDYMIKHKTDHREAVQVIADLCHHYVRNDPSVVEDAIGFYKELYTLCPEGANVDVYNSFIMMCRTAGNRAAGMFLVKEMASFNVIPNGTTFESIILMCLDAGNYLSASMYFEDLIKREGSVTRETQKEIRKLCARSVDEYAMRLQYHPKLQESIKIATSDGTPSGDATGEAGPRGFGRTKLVHEARIAYNRDRRRRKRARAAMERNENQENRPTDAQDEWY
ncbi:Ribonucleoprotein LSM domain eukaryotic/archaea-type [Penicillium atrosanguineum]|nr:Ribonucleoprotein LSM domain eukaryotic/archaea-type [Penicillium atrosanguineum]